MVKSRFERQSGSVLGARSRRAEKKPISSPVAHLSLAPPPSPFPMPAEIQLSSRQKGCVLRTPLRNSLTPSPTGIPFSLSKWTSQEHQRRLSTYVSEIYRGWHGFDTIPGGMHRVNSCVQDTHAHSKCLPQIGKEHEGLAQGYKPYASIGFILTAPQNNMGASY